MIEGFLLVKIDKKEQKKKTILTKIVKNIDARRRA